MNKLSFLGFIFFTMIIFLNAITVDYFHCKAATCHEFYYGLRNFPRQKEYVNVCYDTVRSLQDISQKYGKCFDETSKKLNPACIYALATTMKNCIHGLKGIPELYARYHCGYRLMQNCAKHIGLDRFPYKLEYQQPVDDGI